MENPTIECVESYETAEGLTYGKFIAEPLDKGYGITLGNSLRRVLLSDLEGAAITAIKIDGVLHEFSTIDGMVEDVLDVIMNLKQVAFRLYSESSKVVSLSVVGPAIVTAADIQADSDVEVVNKHQHLATLQDGAKLDLEMRLESGKGFVPAEQVKREELPLGWLPIDAIYMPVQKVNYKVENTRVGQITNYDRLVLEVWTNGSIEPDKAISTSAGILARKFQHFTVLSGDPISLDSGIMERGDSTEKTKEEETSIEDLELSIRAYNCLKRANIFTLADLLKKSERELMEIKNFGKKSAEEVIEKVHTMGYLLRGGRSKDNDDYDEDEAE
ncbi:MAG: DNA-directed RNA polymerase subunit alpha [Candidatus Sericytochromatia bacterium]